MSFKLTYNLASNPVFQMAMQKIAQTPTDAKTSYIVSKVVRELKKFREKISEEYKAELMEPFAARDEKGEFNPDEWKCQEGREAELEKVQEEFGKREFTVLRPLLTFDNLKNVKLSAAEIETLLPALDEKTFEKPEAPVNPMRVAT